MNIPTLEVAKLLHRTECRQPFYIDSILEKYYQNEEELYQKSINECAYQTFIHLLIVGSIKANETCIYLF